MSKQRSKLRKQCKPKGPIGYLLETVHLNQASMDMDCNIWQYNQTPIRITNAAHQVIGPQIQQMAARNRTARKEDSREECRNLREIDREATNSKNKGLTEEDMMILNVERTGSAWTKKAAYEAGQALNDLCELCGYKEDAGHIWTCEALKTDREEADKEIAAINPNFIHSACKHGIAPAMTAKLKSTYWGGSKKSVRWHESFRHFLQLV